MKNKKIYGVPRLERYGSLSELSAGGSGSMQEGSGFIGQVGGPAGSMSGPGFGMMDSRP